MALIVAYAIVLYFIGCILKIQRNKSIDAANVR